MQVQAKADFADRSLRRQKQKKDPKTHPYKQGQVNLRSPQPFKQTLNWLEHQNKIGGVKSPNWSHQLYHASPGDKFGIWGSN